MEKIRATITVYNKDEIKEIKKSLEGVEELLELINGEEVEE